MDKVLDIEDLRYEGKLGGFCPYYVQTSVKDTCNFLIAPYDYILDPLILDAFGF